MTNELGSLALVHDTQHVFHCWSAQTTRNPIAIAGASGCEVWDFDGKRYLDFSSQLVNVNIGHSHPKIIASIKQQSECLATIAPDYANLIRGKAASKILDHAGPGFEKVFFTSGGADANENAIRMARLTTGRDTVLSTYRSYHGSTGTAIVASGNTSRRAPNQFSRGHVHFFGPFLYRSEFWATEPKEECERALQHLRRVVECEGSDTIAAIILETVPGGAGVLVPPRGWLAGVRRICNEYGIIMICDEIMCGFGRTGDWFAWQNEELNPEGIIPDLITFAKGVNSGYVPAGGVIICPKIAHAFDEIVFQGGMTYSGHPLAMASIVANIEAFEEDQILANATMIGRNVLGPGLQELSARHSMIGEVRGLGVFWALDLVTDRGTRRPLSSDKMAAIKKTLISKGVLPYVNGNRVHVAPPCTVNQQEVERALAIYDEVFAAFAI